MKLSNEQLALMVEQEPEGLLGMITMVDPPEIEDDTVRKLVQAIRPLLSVLELKLTTEMVASIREKGIQSDPELPKIGVRFFESGFVEGYGN